MENKSSFTTANNNTSTRKSFSNNNNDKTAYRACPRRPYAITTTTTTSSAAATQQHCLPPTTSVIGLGCSSFSTFFFKDSSSTNDESSKALLTRDTITKDNPTVQAWIQTIHHAILNRKITLLDTAPWYGHGTSEIVIGFALEDILSFNDNDDDDDDDKNKINREDVIINTKIGRYEATPLLSQFDYSYSTVLSSTQTSVTRMKCKYINVLQLHDAEFSPSTSLLLEETIPAMIYCRDELSIVKAIGITGYPLEMQHEILVKSTGLVKKGGGGVGGGVVFDQSLTYCHANLHDLTLLKPLFSLSSSSSPDNNNENMKQQEDKTIKEDQSFLSYCHSQSIALLTAAPFSMGLLTNDGPPSWHPAPIALKQACREAVEICRGYNVDIANLATLFALSRQRRRRNSDTGGMVCLIVGMKSRKEVDDAVDAALRFPSPDDNDDEDDDAYLKRILTPEERQAFETLRNETTGPFASVWKSGEYQWDGMQIANDFWNDVEGGKEAAETRMRRRG